MIRSLLPVVLLALTVLACSSGPSGGPEPTPHLVAPTVEGWPSSDVTQYDGEAQGAHVPPFFNAANPSVTQQIYRSDAVVRASLVSATNGVLRFRVLEYLKGSGPSDITIAASTVDRSDQYDNHEAILFLTTPASDGAAGGVSGNTGTKSFEFTEGIYDVYRGGFPAGYGINQENRAWMPATSAGGATGQSGTTAFDPGAPAPGRMHDPSLTVEQIKAIITWLSAQSTSDYQECVKHVLHNEHHYRSWYAFHGTLKRPEFLREISSGVDAGAVIHQTDEAFGAQYATLSVEGDDAALFSYTHSDDDTNPRNVYTEKLATTRPLPAGSYSITSVMVSGYFGECNHTPAEGYGGRLYWTVKVTAPSGTLHETMFDPVTFTGGVGATTNQGAISHRDFSVGASSGSVSVLRWRNGKVVLKLDPFVSLAGYRLDFIETDGSVGLSLDAASATEDSGAKTLRWDVTEQPWEDGDLLMVRIGLSLQVSISADNPSPMAGQAVTFTPAITNAPQNATPTYDWQFKFGDGDWLSAASGATLKTQGNSGETVGYRVVVKYGSGVVATSGTVRVSWP